MKKLIILGLCLFSINLYAQPPVDDEKKSTEIEIGSKKIIIQDGDKDKMKKKDRRKRKNVDTDFLEVDFGMNWLSQAGEFNLPAHLRGLETNAWGSFNIGLNFFTTRVNLIKHHLNLLTGVTVDLNQYKFSNNTTLVPDQLELNNFITNDSIDFKKSKLYSSYVQIPLMLQFQTAPGRKSRNFHIAIGGFGGLRIASHTKQVSDERGKQKIWDDYNLNNVRYGITGRIGYRGLQFYANYNLSSMFRDDVQLPEITPLTVGISLTGGFR